MKIYLFDSTEAHENLLPLSFTRPLAEFRCGILTIRQKWENLIPGEYSYFPMEYLREKFGSVTDIEEEALYITGNLLPDNDIIEKINSLIQGQALVNKIPEKQEDSKQPASCVLAFRGSLKELLEGNFSYELYDKPCIINYLFDLFLKNGDEIKKDFNIVTAGKTSQKLPDCVRLLSCTQKNTEGSEMFSNHSIFIEEGAQVECATINTAEGPVYIGKDAVLMEGACIRGPFALCEEAEVRMGAKVYEGTTIGPHCKVGGEISNVIFFGYSNKAHDGYLGNAVIGEWCNIGAGTNASNLKNDYSLIRVWNYRTRTFMKTDLQFCGLIMGDHSKIGVNCMINTATVIGVGVNIHGSGFPRQFVPCFCEGSPTAGFTKVPLKKFLDTAERVMSRRHLSSSPNDIALLTHIYKEQ